MRTYIAKRLLLMVPTLLVITIVSYMMMRLAPGDPVRASILASGESGGARGGTGLLTDRESRQARVFREHFNLDKPWYVGYWYWLTGDPKIPERRGVLRGDFGVSITVSLSVPVWDLLRERLPVTLKLNLWAIGIMYLLAIPCGLLAAVYRDSLMDRTTALVFFLLYSLPSFWVGLLLIVTVSRFFPEWPTYGLSSWRHWVLPVVCLTYGGLAGLSRYARVGMLETIRQDYIRTARAKGLSEPRVILKHALRNSVIPLVTVFAGLLPGLVAGSIFSEFLFGIPGMGSLSIQALGSRDYPVLMTLFALSAVLTLLGILVSDILYAAVDPRITFD